MASPPIYASSKDARNDRGARPLRMESLKRPRVVKKDSRCIGIKERQRQTGAVVRGGRGVMVGVVLGKRGRWVRLVSSWWGGC